MENTKTLLGEVLKFVQIEKKERRRKQTEEIHKNIAQQWEYDRKEGTLMNPASPEVLKATLKAIDDMIEEERKKLQKPSSEKKQDDELING